MSSQPNYHHLAHLKIPLEDIVSATDNFAKENLTEKADFGNAYVGQLSWSGELTKIDARRWNKEWSEREQEFWMEISMLSSLKHKNLVSLVGFCDENDEKITINKLETGASLENYLSDPVLLTWVKRLEICVGLAHALSYIHYDEAREFSVIHRNIDSLNVLLNDNLEPKLSEFRLSMKIEASQRHDSFCVDKVWDREGYTDPTYIETKSVSHKSDIYSFGIVMFELMCARKAVIDDDQDNKYLASVAVAHYREKKLNEIIDWVLWNQMDSQSLNVFAETAYDCLNEERSQRPSIDEIVTRLEKALELARVNKHRKSSPKDKFAHLRIPLEYILSATNNFTDFNIIRRSEVAMDYKGQLSWSGELINITARRLHKEVVGVLEQEFWMEISLLSSLAHKNVVSLVGFCYENGEKVIINRNEMARGRLGKYLSDPMLLTWVRRLEICVGLAHALSYIHYDESRDFSIIHRLITSDTVLLNDDCEPKLSTFEGSMKIIASQRHHSFHTCTPWYAKGYEDPTYIETKSVNHKSDMYSFGIVLFELLCGRKSGNESNKYLAPLAITHYRAKRLDEIIDPVLRKQIDLQSFNMLAEIAYECLAEERSQRPNIDDIVPRLEKALELARENRPRKSWPKDEFAHLRIPLEYILSATNNFTDINVIRRSEVAMDYKGQLECSGELINITARRLNKEFVGVLEQEFWMEISLLSILKHKNVVSLVGFCDENGEKVIINRNETARGRLGKYLSDPMLLTWVRRLEICVGLAHALSYIHYDESRDFSIIHRLITSDTVLLNDVCEPKLSTFEGSMKIIASQRHHSFHTNTPWYAKGYEDPTYIETKSVNHKSDMYSFGIVLFELLCGRRAIIDSKDDNHLAPLAITRYREKRLDEIIDPVLRKQIDLQSFNMFAEIAYECLAEERSRRPNIDDIVPRLEKALELARENRPDNSIVEQDNSIVEGASSFMHKKFQHLKIELQAIKSATNKFNVSQCIGRGGFGKVYRGELVHSKGKSVVALKRLDRSFGQGDPEFWKEIIMLSLYRHDNIVSLLGFCDDCGEKILVYEYASKRSLNLYLDDKDLMWVQRLKICIGAARGLAYLHNPGETQQRVLHRDIKSFNILLDENWNAKIADFGLSKFGPANQQYTFLVSNGVGTIGYCDPLYVKTGLLTKESDVYSFGVVLFEMLCGRLCISNNHAQRIPLTALVHKCYEQKTIADIVYGNIKDDINPDSLKAFTTIAYQCLHSDQEQRPLMTEVVKALESALICQVSNEPPTSSFSRKLMNNVSAEEDTLP